MDAASSERYNLLCRHHLATLWQIGGLTELRMHNNAAQTAALWKGKILLL